MLEGGGITIKVCGLGVGGLRVQVERTESRTVEGERVERCWLMVGGLKVEGHQGPTG